jgi:hypothetical protein
MAGVIQMRVTTMNKVRTVPTEGGQWPGKNEGPERMAAVLKVGIGDSVISAGG